MRDSIRPTLPCCTTQDNICHHRLFNFATSFLRQDGRHDADTPMELVLDHVEYILQRVGEDGVGFGSDFDGARIPARIGNAGALQSLVAAMRMRGYGERLIEKLCYENWLRVLESTWGRKNGEYNPECIRSRAMG